MSVGPTPSAIDTLVETEVLRRLCATCPVDARICLVSDVGTFHASSEEQEHIVHGAASATTLVLRLRNLTLQPVPFRPTSIPRYQLATRILDWCG